MDEVPITPRSIDSFAPLIGERRMDQLANPLAETQERIDGATVWHVNSTAAGGRVAEMLQSVLSYPSGADIDVRWLVIDGSDAFFEMTKRLHHLLHGSRGDDGPLDDAQRKLYEKTLGREEKELTTSRPARGRRRPARPSGTWSCALPGETRRARHMELSRRRRQP